MHANDKHDPLRDLFTRVAKNYDLLNRSLTFGIDVLWRKRALRRLTSAGKVLDLACGTGDLSIAIAKRFHDTEVTGLDLTPAMMEIGRRKIESEKLSERINLIEGNALALPFDDNSFDTVTCAFGFRNFPDKAKAVSEAARVLKPGGTLLVLELFRIKSPFLSRITSLWLKIISPILAGATKKDYEYLRASIEHTLTADEFTRLCTGNSLTCKTSSFFYPSCHCLTFTKGC